MAFKVSLFELLEHSDSSVIINNCEIDFVQDSGVDAAGNPVLNCICDEDNDWYFADQEVVVDEKGNCKAATAVGDWVDGEESFMVDMSFFVTRPITESDLLS